MCQGQQQVLEDSQVLSVSHARGVEGQVGREAASVPGTNVVEVRLLQVGPELTLLVPVDREVQDPETKYLQY